MPGTGSALAKKVSLQPQPKKFTHATVKRVELGLPVTSSPGLSTPKSARASAEKPKTFGKYRPVQTQKIRYDSAVSTRSPISARPGHLQKVNTTQVPMTARSDKSHSSLSRQPFASAKTQPRASSINRSLDQSLVFGQQSKAEVEELLLFLLQEGLTSQLQEVFRKHASQRTSKTGSPARTPQNGDITKLRMTFVDLQRFQQDYKDRLFPSKTDQKNLENIFVGQVSQVVSETKTKAGAKGVTAASYSADFTTFVSVLHHFSRIKQFSATSH